MTGVHENLGRQERLVAISDAALDRMWDYLKQAQEKELDAQDSKRAELEAVENFMQQAEVELEEITLALHKASRRAGESLKLQLDDANARFDGYIACRSEIQKDLVACKVTDDALIDIMNHTKDVQFGM